MTVRIIPRLDIKGPNLVKGIHLEGQRVLGKPEDFARYYYENGADELFFQDSVASLYGRNNLNNIIEQTVKDIFIPLTVGGGLRSINDIRTVLNSGADKVALNTAVINDPNLIREASRTFGSSTIVVSLEVIKQENGNYHCFTDCGREKTGLDAFEWAQKACDLGAGEILITSVDMEGTGRGYDLGLIKKISQLVSVPVIAHGGAGNVEDICSAVKEGKADAVCVASIFHYDFFLKCSYEDKHFIDEGNIEFIKQSKENNRIKGVTIPEVKGFMQECGIKCRI